MKLSQEEKEYLVSKKITLWLKEYQIKNEQGVPIEFKDHLFLYDIYNDFSPLQVILKAAQIGFSTTAILKTLWACKYKGIDSIYTLPTIQDSRDFVGGKVNRIIAQNPILQEWVKDKDSVDQKSVGENLIYYRGTWTEKAAIMVSSDLNVYDEVDRSKQDVIEQYSSRLQHSKHKMEWYFSNPSVLGNGVSKYWDRSDQKHWFITCSRCNYKQYLKWPDNIDMDKEIYVCRSCHQELREEDRRVGEWVYKYKLGTQAQVDNRLIQRDVSGYWISLMMAPWVTAKEIVNLYKTKSKEFFYNFVLGLPYIGEGNNVTPDIIFRNLTSEVNDQERVVIGCDSGIKKHYVCGNSQGLFYYGVTENWDDIESLLKQWPRSIAVIDHFLDITGPRKLREKFPGRVFLCHYSADRKTMQMVRWGENEEDGNVIVDRNRVIQMIVDEFADKQIPLQGVENDWYDYYLHWKTMFRISELDALGSPRIKWESSTGEDHWCHATVYWRAGMSRFGNPQGKIISTEFNGDIPLGPEIIDDKTHFILPNRKQTNDWRIV